MNTKFRNLFNERFGYHVSTVREVYPTTVKRRGGLHPEFVRLYKAEKDRLVTDGVCPKKVHRLIAKALKFYK